MQEKKGDRMAKLSRAFTPSVFPAVDGPKDDKLPNFLFRRLIELAKGARITPVKLL
jgi:hypothetical protein